MQIAIDLPEDFLCLKDEQKIRKDVTLAYALRLLKAQRITLSTSRIKDRGLIG
ncbi:hypothetical protein Thiowin_02755 [Thiorhodovibrio winogradskyi]|uniref:Uncharacterized protein n=1 Tax=Thiorhodovibrio winogradskyi TaxID=77007 RepID=A0ABZ0SC89_9GAMM|nr:hypothetical protein [Thiorhodovibrio winogradskyi]